MRKPLALLLLAVAACGGTDSNATGKVEVALITKDAGDGVVYRLTAGTRLLISNPTFFGDFTLDGDVPLVSINVPPGDYSAVLHNAAGYTDVWPLERIQADGTTDVVNAVLATEMPAALTVPDGFSVTLPLQFKLAGGTITFDKGTIDVSVAVDVAGATGGRFSALSGDLAVVEREVSPAAPTEIIEKLPALGDTGLFMTIIGQLSGPWFQTSPLTACAPIAVSWSGGPSLGLQDLISEAHFVTEMCVVGDELFIEADHYVLPTTPTFEPAGTFLSFQVQLLAVLPEPVFDGVTLDISRLNRTAGLPAFVEARVIQGSDTWYRAQINGNVAFSFTPTGD